MFRLRLTAGRATAPLGQPPIAVARGIEIPPPEILPFADSRDLALRADAAHALLYQAPPVPETYSLSPAVFQLPPWTSVNPVLMPDDDGERFSPGFDPPPINGGRITLPLPQRLGGAPELPQASRLTSDSALWAHPFLEPSPALDADSVYLGFPRTLRRYQVEAVQHLLSHDGFLLADDPGTGKTVAACAALQVLFQSRQVRRSLIVFLESGARHWAAHLAAWAPGLAVTAVHGDGPKRTELWQSSADVFLVDYGGLGADLESGRLTSERVHFDLIVLDDVHVLQRRASQPHPLLDRLVAPRRWALSGALPREAGEWLTVFGFLTPDRGLRASEITLPNLTRRFLPDTLRRTKAELLQMLPRLTRDEIWVDLDPAQRRAYDVILAEERDRLAALGAAVTRSHLEAAIRRLRRACNFAQGLLDGCKVRPLVSIIEDIVAAGSKVVVFSQFRDGELENLRRVLEAYGVAVAQSEAPEATRDEALQRFRTEPAIHVLLADDQLRPSGGPLTEASYIIHFDHSSNPAVRRRAEMRMHPDPGPPVAVNVMEFWVVDTIDERIHELLAERSLLPTDLPNDVRPALLEDRLTPVDLMQRVLEVPEWSSRFVPAALPESAALVEPQETWSEEAVPETSPGAGHQAHMPSEIASPIEEATAVTEPGALPSAFITNPLEPPAASAEGLRPGVERLMKALGFDEPAPESEVPGRDMIVQRGLGAGRERALVRLLPSGKDIGVAEARSLLKALNARPELATAFLISNADFTPACRRLALESGGRLRLIPGVDLGDLIEPGPQETA